MPYYFTSGISLPLRNFYFSYLYSYLNFCIAQFHNGVILGVFLNFDGKKVMTENVGLKLILDVLRDYLELEALHITAATIF